MFSVNRPQNPIKKVKISAIFRGTSKRLIHNLFKIQAGSGFWNLDNTSKNRYHKVTKFEEVNHLMEKKGTRIAYFIALAIVVIALVIAKVANDGSGFVATGWALFPPIVAIALALISKEVYSSLFLGCVVGALLLANFQPWQMVVNFIGAGEGVGMINAIDISILIFLVILGIMVDLMNKAGGSAAFGRWAKKAVKTRSGAQLLTMLLGVLIFIDDYFNCLTVGAVMRPVTESHKISRAKLAYIIDATAAPVCMLAPVSSWAAAVASYVPDGFPGSRISMFLSQIPFNYYCILTLVMVIVTSLLNIDYGPMLTHEYNAQVKDDLFTTPERPFEGADDYEEGAKHSSVLDLLLPVIVLIALCIVGLVWTGGMWDTESDNYGNFVMSFSDASAGTGLCLGSIIALVFTFMYYWLRGLITFEKSMEAIPNGFIQMISPILILCFAWTLCGLCRDNGLQVGAFADLGVDLLAGNQFPGRRVEQVQQRELLAREGDLLSVADHRVTLAVDREPRGRGLLGRSVGVDALEDRLHAAYQQLHLDRLGQVVVGSHVEPCQLLPLLAQRREENHHRVLQHGVSADRAAGLRPVHHRHHHVQQDQVRTAFGGHFQRLGAVLRREYFVALFQEVVPHEFEDVDFIVDKQDAVAHGSG